MFDGTPVYFMMDNAWFRTVLVVSKGWKEIGWNAMIYIADIAGMDEKIYESAVTI